MTPRRLNVQDVLAGRVEVTLTLPLFGGTVIVMLPVPRLHVPSEIPPENTSPAGSVSVKAIPPRVIAFGLVNVKVKVEVPPGTIAAGEKDLVIVAGEVTMAAQETAQTAIASHV